jgi:hypothetical protein
MLRPAHVIDTLREGANGDMFRPIIQPSPGQSDLHKLST